MAVEITSANAIKSLNLKGTTYSFTHYSHSIRPSGPERASRATAHTASMQLGVFYGESGAELRVAGVRIQLYKELDITARGPSQTYAS